LLKCRISSKRYSCSVKRRNGLPFIIRRENALCTPYYEWQHF
jgi:hypothetical protein